MRTIPVSPDVTFIGTGKAAARAAYAELSDGSRKRIPGEQAKNDDGVPLYVVDVLYLSEDSDRAEICGVRIASWEPPATTVGQIVKFRNLVAVPYVDGRSGRVALSFRAEGIEASAASSSKAA
ncbi:hypothetical protein [Pseudonocardia sp.]|uniref:hypothetical protein n=1 Tax=Pseudonocardia sp. TaxID=60912 RepID=UPI003D0C873C